LSTRATLPRIAGDARRAGAGRLRSGALALLLAALMSSPALAVCGPGPDTGDQRAHLHTELLGAADATAGEALAEALRAVWRRAPDAEAQFLLDRALARREAWDFAASETLFDALIAYCPTFADAFYQRGFVRFLRENYDPALADLDAALAADPFHFDALATRALILMRQGDIDGGQQVLRTALRLNPYLRERLMLIPDADGRR